VKAGVWEEGEAREKRREKASALSAVGDGANRGAEEKGEEERKEEGKGTELALSPFSSFLSTSLSPEL